MSPEEVREYHLADLYERLQTKKKKKKHSELSVVFTNELELVVASMQSCIQTCVYSTLYYQQDDTVECNTIITAVAHLVIACLQPTRLYLTIYLTLSTTKYNCLLYDTNLYVFPLRISDECS